MGASAAGAEAAGAVAAAAAQGGFPPLQPLWVLHIAHRSLSCTPARAEEMCCPQPFHVGLEQSGQLIFMHISEAGKIAQIALLNLQRFFFFSRRRRRRRGKRGERGGGERPISFPATRMALTLLPSLVGILSLVLPAVHSQGVGVFTVNASFQHQVILGLGFEIQSDSIGSGNEGMPDANTSVPLDLTPSERTRFYTEMLSGFRLCRLALGLYFRGLSPDNKTMQDRWPGQSALLAEMAAAAGLEGFAVECACIFPISLPLLSLSLPLSLCFAGCSG